MQLNTDNVALVTVKYVKSTSAHSVRMKGFQSKALGTLLLQSDSLSTTLAASPRKLLLGLLLQLLLTLMPLVLALLDLVLLVVVVVVVVVNLYCSHLHCQCDLLARAYKPSTTTQNAGWPSRNDCCSWNVIGAMQLSVMSLASPVVCVASPLNTAALAARVHLFSIDPNSSEVCPVWMSVLFLGSRLVANRCLKLRHSSIYSTRPPTLAHLHNKSAE
jgi:hypothetical protein